MKTLSRRYELVELLDDYAPTPGEIKALAEMRTLARHPHDVLSAYTYDPGHFTVSAFVTDVAVSRLVLIHHGRVGAWLQPGGHIEPADASLAAAVRREVREETGLAALESAVAGLFDIDVHRVPAYRAQPAHRHFDLRFHLTTAEELLVPPPDGDEVRWSQLDAVATLTQDRSVLRSLRKLVAVDPA
jgi:8-oxo-dGTP pyrophosphatase MutT (NUDIX family)